MPEGWEARAIGEVCDVNPSRREVASLPNDLEVSFVPMAAVSEDGRLIAELRRRAGEVKKGFPAFKERDVLLAKITPCFENGKRWLARSLVNGMGFASTEFHVLRAHPEVLPEWIYYLVSTRRFREDGKRRMTGTAGQKRVPASFIQEAAVPVPPVAIQKRLVEVIARVEQLENLRVQADGLADRVARSAFLKMFGDPATNPKGWENARLGDLIVDLRYGTSVKCSSSQDGVPVLRIPNVLRGSIDLSDLKYARLDAEDLGRYRLQDGDMLFVRTNGNREYVGRCAVFHGTDRSYAFASYLIRGRLDRTRLDPDFARVLLSFPAVRDQLFLRARTSAGQYNINTPGIRTVATILPPLDLQERFVGVLSRVEQLREQHTRSRGHIQGLFDSVVSRAFRGDLPAADAV